MINENRHTEAVISAWLREQAGEERVRKLAEDSARAELEESSLFLDKEWVWPEGARIHGES